MVIKKYIAVTEEQALEMAKDELGANLVIMNVKRTSPGGIFKFFKKPSVELTAAIDDAPNDERKTAESEKKPDFSKLQEAIKNQEEYAAPDSKAAQQKEKREKLKESDQIITEEDNNREKDSGVLEEKIVNSLQDLLEKQGFKAEAEVPEKISKDKKSKDKIQNKTDDYFNHIKEKLLENEVQEEYIMPIIDAVRSGNGKNVTLDNILAGVYQKIILSIGPSHLIDIRTKKTKYIFFIGPTGVGKTTTIAKIASTLKLTKKTKVALVSADTYRIAAIDQLKTYANILGVPLEVVYTPDEMDKTKEKLKDFDLVLVDTAGRSHHNKSQINEVKELIERIPPADREIYLVLSATTKYKDLVKIVETYKKVSDYYLIFTKIDETEELGNIFNIRMLTGAALSYATWGQNVPDDIGKIDAQIIAKQLLGGNR